MIDDTPVSLTTVSEQGNHATCPACFRHHHPESWVCSACDRKFKCSSQFISAPTLGGMTIRGHIRPGAPDSLGEACGPIARVVVGEARTPLEKARLRTVAV